KIADKCSLCGRNYNCDTVKETSKTFAQRLQMQLQPQFKIILSMSDDDDDDSYQWMEML
ncbi:hypothetical protein A2U01_0066831, partial [Trifolium medium]|nr:hypothetical protein [Trifolium medium]